VISTLERRVC